jgi:hypothetical protein
MSRRTKRKRCSYTVPDSDEEDEVGNPHLNRLIAHSAKRAKPNLVSRCTQTDSAVNTKSQATEIDLSITYPSSMQSTQTDNNIANTGNLQPTPPDTETVSTKANTTLTCSAMSFRWGRKSGKHLQAKLRNAIKDEQDKDLKNASKSKRRIDLKLLGQVLWHAANFSFVTRRLQTKSNAIVLCMFRYLLEWKPELFQDALLVESRQFLRRHVFQPWKFQKSIDTNAAGGLNYESCNSIRNDVEELDSNTIGVIPHGTTIAKYAKLLEKHAVHGHGLVINVDKTTHGPSLWFELDTILRMIICGFGLDKIAATGSSHKPVIIAHTLDGAMLTSHLGHVTAGIKIVDPRALDPTTGIPIGIAGLFQTRDLCFPLQIVFGKDCKDLYTDCFGSLHGRFNGGLVIPPTIGCPELSNFQVISPQDMSSIWKTTGLGGGCYNKRQFCYCCMCSNDLISVSKTGDNRCGLCLKLDIGRCFCHPVNDRVFYQETALMLEQHVQSALDEGFSRLDHITANSKINTNPLTADRIRNPGHIDFVPSGDSEVGPFNQLLKDELKLRLGSNRESYISSLVGTYTDRRAKLKAIIAEEAKIHLARKTIDRRDSIRGIAEKVLAEEAVPCILHLEMRINEKLFWTLLSVGLDRYQDGDSATRKACVAKVTECMKTTVLGNLANETEYQWKFPLKDSGKKVEPKSMTNVHSRRCVMGIKTLANIIFSDILDEKSSNATTTRQKNSSKLKQWEDLMATYHPLMELIRRHEDFTESDINNLHSLSLKFMGQWVDSMDGQSITNYIHMIGAGHLTYYVSKYKNLYKYSQQGWEALNQKLKYFYFHNTNHGGCGGKQPGALSGDHVLPLMRLIQRSIMWTLGHGDAFSRGDEATSFQQADETQADAYETAII